MPAKLSRNLSFHFLWSSTFASGFADRLAMLAVAVMLGQGVTDGGLSTIRLGDAAIIAGINFWFFLPYVVWGPFGGWLADRLPRKWLMFVSDEARGVLILLALAMLPPGGSGAIENIYDTWITLEMPWGDWPLSHTWKVWGMMFAIGVFAATFSPTRNSVIPNVVGYRVLQRANSVVLGLGVIGNLVGFAIGGKLATDALQACILTSALCYLLSGLLWPFLQTPALRTVKRPQGPPRRRGPLTPLVEIADGGRYILRHHPLLALTVVSILFWTGAQIIMAAGAAIAVDLYGGTVEEFAYIGGAFGFGMLAGALVLGLMNTRRGGEIIVTVGMVGAAAFLSLLVIVPYLWAGIALALACGLFGGLLLVSINTMVQQMSADHYRGRVMGFKDLASDLGGVTVNLAIWQVAEADNYIFNLAHAFSVLLVITAIYGTWRYLLRGPHDKGRLNLMWRLDRLYVQAMHRLHVVGAHRVPRHGPLLIVANHTSAVDPMLIQSAIPRRVRWMMATDMMVPLLRPLWRAIQIIPVNREAPDSRSARTAIDALRRGDTVGVFPEGGINRQGDQLRPFMPGIGVIAAKARATVVPVYVAGTPNTDSVYGGVLRVSHATVTFGEPIEAARFEGLDREAAVALIRQRLEAVRDAAERQPQDRDAR